MNNIILNIKNRFELILKLFSLLSTYQKKKSLYLFFLLLIGVFFETLSIGLIIPVLVLLTNQNNESFEFINSLSKFGLNAFETRKCTFMIDENFSEENFKKLVKFGLEFELEWLEHKKNVYAERSRIDDSRINSIISRCKN